MSSTTEAMAAEPSCKASDIRGKFINANLLSLKCLLFFFFGGMGCLLPFLPLHMLAVGLSPQEIRTISMIAPAAALLGPLIAGPLADRMAMARYRQPSGGGCGDKGAAASGNGRYLRVMIAVCCVFSALFYGLLFLVPSVRRVDVPHNLRPAVKLTCDATGALVHQERCRGTLGCHRWSDEDALGALRLTRCTFACRDPARRAPDPVIDLGPASVVPLGADATEPPEDLGSGELGVVPLEAARARDVRALLHAPGSEAPRVCYTNPRGLRICHLFTESRESLPLVASLRHARNPEVTDEWCAFPVAQSLECRIPVELEIAMARINQSCLVECQLEDPYDVDMGMASVLSESQCREVIGNEDLTFWMYLAIRCFADIFPTAAVALIDAAVVIATRETSTGRGDVGRQLAFGSLGFAALGPLSGYLATLLGPGVGHYVPIGLHALLVLLAACIALSANEMPLSPPEWWWHTCSGMLAVPMSAVRKYGGETAALFLVLLLMGALWSAMDTYLSLHLVHLRGDELSIGLALTVGALPAVLFLWKSENLVDYCGHSNLLITAFIIYIVRFTGLSIVPDVWWALISEALELFTLGIMWVTAILYFRHLIPRQMTATGQALPVIAHFCIGRAIGAVIGACVDKIDRGDEVESMRYIYQCLAIAAAAIATLYFVLYHGILKPRCHAQTVSGGQRQPPTIVQAMNGNGNYTPLRVYHNGMGRKGQFRY